MPIYDEKGKKSISFLFILKVFSLQCIRTLYGSYEMKEQINIIFFRVLKTQ